jgi:toxin HigB-1
LGWGGIYKPVVELGTGRVQSLTGIEIRNWTMAQNLSDMRAPPGNRLEVLSGDRKGQWSIRINVQYRICFRWIDDGPLDVEIVDYH